MKDIISKVDEEKLFQHVLSVEGVKHPLLDPKKLNETADYIKSEFQKYDLTTSEQTFEIEGYDMTFRNIEGHIGDETKPELLVTSHYDTVLNAPGADDNGSAIAGMLETARVLAEEKFVGNVRFISFTLEEGHPSLVKKYRDKRLELGLINDSYQYTSYHSQKMIKRFLSKANFRIAKGQPMLDSWNKTYEEIKENLTEAEKKYCKYFIETRKDITRTTWLGKLGLVGSDFWVRKAIEAGKQIRGVINLESIGYTSKRKHSQIFPPLMTPLIFPSYKVKLFKSIGNFISIVSDKNSKQLGKAFCKNCKHEEIKLPYLWGKIPLRFEKIAKWIKDILRADHAPFWRENIPALMITDTANFRNPYYHTEADTIDKLDFDFMKKVTQATIATILDLSEVHFS
ncbi:MAG: M28 family peptidase [Candidatus Thorarchaeota archaeon]